MPFSIIDMVRTVVSFEQSDHPFILFLLVCTAVLVVGATISELMRWEMWAGFLGVYAVLCFTLWIVSFLSITTLKRFSS